MADTDVSEYLEDMADEVKCLGNGLSEEPLTDASLIELSDLNNDIAEREENFLKSKENDVPVKAKEGFTTTNIMSNYGTWIFAAVVFLIIVYILYRTFHVSSPIPIKGQARKIPELIIPVKQFI